MAELDKLSELLSSPEKMEEIMTLAKSFLGGSASDTETNSGEKLAVAGDVERETSAGNGSATLVPTERQGSGDSSLASLLSNLDPKFMTLAMSLISEYSNDDDKIRLLNALKPHLKEDRRGSLEKAVTAFRLSKSIKTLMRNWGGGGGV